MDISALYRANRTEFGVLASSGLLNVNYRGDSTPNAYGGTFVFRSVGIERDLGGKFSYARHFPVSPKLSLAAGLGVGFINILPPATQTGKGLPPSRERSEQQEAVWDLSGGTALIHERFTAGIGILHLTEPHFDIFSQKVPRTWNGFLTAEIPIKAGLSVVPSLQVEHRPNRTPFQIQALARFDDTYETGLQYRRDGTISLVLRIEYPHFLIGYSFDAATQGVTTLNDNTHEMAIRFFVARN